MGNLLRFLLLVFTVAFGLTRADTPANPPVATTNEVSVFLDGNLESAVRQQVFAKRYTNSPLVAADVANVSTVVANYRGITNLTGLEHCKALAALELAGNSVANLTPLTGLRQLQLLLLTSNQITEIGPLGTLPALQYIELSHNSVTDAASLSVLTNLASVYLGNNQLTTISALTNLPRLVTLYAESNSLKTIEGLQNLRGLSGVSLAGNQIENLAPLTGIRAPSFVFLERNRIKELTPLNTWITNDLAGPRAFAPYLQLYLKGNPLSSKAEKLAAEWTESGVRVNQ